MFWQKKSAIKEKQPVAAEVKQTAPIQVKAPDRKEGGQQVKINTKQEIQQKIESLMEPGESAFFYLAGSPANGGPLGRGAAVIELNPNYPGKKQHKFIVYVADVDGTEVNCNKNPMFQTDKASDIANWIKERHYLPIR
jgi:hypothetical protein